MSKMVSDVLVGVLEQIGVRHIFGLIGDSLNPLADAIRGGPGCLNRFSASISGASAGVRLPSGVAAG